jgi:hypothetical protein
LLLPALLYGLQILAATTRKECLPLQQQAHRHPPEDLQQAAPLLLVASMQASVAQLAASTQQLRHGTAAAAAAAMSSHPHQGQQSLPCWSSPDLDSAQHSVAAACSQHSCWPAAQECAAAAVGHDGVHPEMQELLLRQLHLGCLLLLAHLLLASHPAPGPLKMTQVAAAAAR